MKTQDVLYGFPPNYDQLCAAFPGQSLAKCIFSWGEHIYNPGKITITPALHDHELVHGQHQGRSNDEIRHWWARYIADPQFRLHEEIVAHQAEFRRFYRTHGDRNDRARYLLFMADRLSGPMYGNALLFGEAKSLIVDGLRSAA
jgi:hypothetical protein